MTSLKILHVILSPLKSCVTRNVQYTGFAHVSPRVSS